MIIDVHHHAIPLTLNETALKDQAQQYWATYSGGNRAHAIDVTVEDIKKRLLATAPDPHGEKLLERMAKAGIDVTVMCVADSIGLGKSDEECLATNRTYAGIANASHGKILALAGIDPRRKNAPELLRRCLEEYGMTGLKWHADNGYSPVSPEAYAELRVLEKLNGVLLTHTGPLPNALTQPPARRWTDFAAPMLLDNVTQDFPGLKVIGAHMGRWNWRDWASIAEFRRNLYGDLAMWQIIAVANYDRFCRELRDILDIAGTDSVLFGTDGPGFGAIVPNERFVRIIKELTWRTPPSIKFTQAEVDGILGENARMVFHL